MAIVLSPSGPETILFVISISGDYVEKSLFLVCTTRVTEKKRKKKYIKESDRMEFIWSVFNVKTTTPTIL